MTATKMATAIALSGDEVTKVVGRFTALTGSADTARKIYDGLYQSSLQTGVAVSESAKSFTRFSLAAENIGATRAEVLKLNDTVAKAGILAGRPRLRYAANFCFALYLKSLTSYNDI